MTPPGVWRLEWGPAVWGPIGVYAGWVNDVATGAKAAITGMDWLAMALICFVLPAVLAWLFGLFFRRIGWIREGDLTLE